MSSGDGRTARRVRRGTIGAAALTASRCAPTLPAAQRGPARRAGPRGKRHSGFSGRSRAPAGVG